MSGTMYTNVFTFMLQRDNTTLENNNENIPPDNTNDEDKFWLKIIKNKNELTKVKIKNRTFINSLGNITAESGFRTLQITGEDWSGRQRNPDLDITNNDDIIIIHFNDDSLEKRNFYIDETSEHYLPELKYLIVRLTESIEEASDIITGQGQYYNYIFSGYVVGPKPLTEFNTNFCIKKKSVPKSNGGETILYYPVNWCSLTFSEVNSYKNLNFNVMVKPKYYTDIVPPTSQDLITVEQHLIYFDGSEPSSTVNYIFTRERYDDYGDKGINVNIVRDEDNVTIFQDDNNWDNRNYDINTFQVVSGQSYTVTVTGDYFAGIDNSRWVLKNQNGDILFDKTFTQGNTTMTEISSTRDNNYKFILY